MTPTIRIADSDAEIQACYPVMAQLRPHLEGGDFVPVVRRLQAAAGFRISEWLAAGRYLEIEDLVTDTDGRSRGWGAALFDWLVEHAIGQGCDHVRLVSNVTRLDAHRFYERKGMERIAYYFHLGLG